MTLLRQGICESGEFGVSMFCSPFEQVGFPVPLLAVLWGIPLLRLQQSSGVCPCTNLLVTLTTFDSYYM